jgi:adenylate cyclase
VSDTLHTALYVLAGIAVLEAGAVAALWVLLQRSRRELEELRQRNEPTRRLEYREPGAQRGL